ncbi:MAG TPA: hypothetical protein VM939_05115, partial [Gemmatimonadaceae bacterium]|nr:hypothetical protein [Gemmatimonadaceae bacterium]
LGTIAPGKLADLVILCADPSANIRNTQAIYAVMKSGRLTERTTTRRPGPLATPPERTCR